MTRPSHVLTFLTDFGREDAYVGAMKGVALATHPTLTLVDLTHDIPPQDIARASFVLSEAAPWYPPGTVHVVVVDPGVGTNRRAMVAHIDGQIVVAPDNGVVSRLWRSGNHCEAWDASDPSLGLERRSATFHCRDHFTPLGAALASASRTPASCGPIISPILLPEVPLRVTKDRADGAIITRDHFGNLVTNLHRRKLPEGPLSVAVEGRLVDRWVRTYGEAERGEIVALFGSGDLLEISRVEGNAATTLGVGVGARVRVNW